MAKRPSSHLKHKVNTIPVSNRQKEVTAEDFKEISEIFESHADEIEDTKDMVIGIGSGEGGKAYPTLAAALIDDPDNPGQPLVPDNVIFQTPEGIWRRDSSDPKGAVFLRDFGATKEDLDEAIRTLDGRFKDNEDAYNDLDVTLNSKMDGLESRVQDDLSDMGSRVSANDTKVNELEIDVDNIRQNVQNIGTGVGGKMYATLAAAIAEPNKPDDGTIFQVSEVTDAANAGVYSFQSGEPDGVKFEYKNRKGISVNTIANLRNYRGDQDEAINVLGYYSQGDGGSREYYWDKLSTEEDDGGATIAVSGISVGRWKLIIEEKINVHHFGAKGDGVKDDTQAFKNAVKVINRTGGILHCLPNKIYNISEPLYLADNVTVDFLESKIRWIGTSDIGNAGSRSIAVFNGHGTLDSTSNVIEFMPKEQLTTNIDDDGFQSSVLGCKVKTEDNSVFSIGDLVALNIETGTNTNSVVNPVSKVVCEVLDLDDGYLVLDYFSPFNWEGKVITGTLGKLSPASNISVRNLEIIDDVVVDPNYATNGQDETFVSGVSFWYSRDCSVENIKGRNTKYPLIITRYSHKFTATKIQLDTPAIFTGGEGYTVQLISNNKCNIGEVYGIRDRHTVDISGGAFYHVKDVFSHRPKFIPFDMHGYCEHSIVWENCIGAAVTSNGLAEFPCINDNIRFINHVGDISTADGYTTNILFENSEVNLRNYHAFSGVFKGCDITWDTKVNSYNLYPQRRGMTADTQLVIDGGSFKILGTGGISFFDIEYEVFRISNCEISEDLNLSPTTKAMLRLRDISQVEINNNNIKGIDRFAFSFTKSKTLTGSISRNKYDYFGEKDSRSMLEFGTLENCRVSLSFDNNRCFYPYTNSVWFLKLDGTEGNKENSALYITGSGNKLIGLNPNSIRSTIAPPIDGVLKYEFSDNILENYAGPDLKAGGQNYIKPQTLKMGQDLGYTSNGSAVYRNILTQELPAGIYFLTIDEFEPDIRARVTNEYGDHLGYNDGVNYGGKVRGHFVLDRAGSVYINFRTGDSADLGETVYTTEGINLRVTDWVSDPQYLIAKVTPKGASGSYSSHDGKTVTVENGLIKTIE